MKKKIKCIAAAGLAAWLAVSPCVAASAAEDETGGDGIITALHDSDKQYHNLESMTKYWDYNILRIPILSRQSTTRETLMASAMSALSSCRTRGRPAGASAR